MVVHRCNSDVNAATARGPWSEKPPPVRTNRRSFLASLSPRYGVVERGAQARRGLLLRPERPGAQNLRKLPRLDCNFPEGGKKRKNAVRDVHPRPRRPHRLPFGTTARAS